MTVNMDFSSADGALFILGKMQREERVRPSEWSGLFRSEGYRALLENRIRTKGDIRRYLLSGVTGDLPGAMILQSDLDGLSLRAEKAVSSLITLWAKWLPEELNFEQPTLAVVPYGGRVEDCDPALLDLRYVLSLEDRSLEQTLQTRVLILLIRRYQNLERFYLRNFFPIRRHMNFIYALWVMQTEGLSLFLSGIAGEESPFPERADALMAEASSCPRGDVERLGREFRDLPGLAEAGARLYRMLALGEEGPELVRRSLIRPTALFTLLRRNGAGLSLSPEAEFFIDRLDELLT